MNIYENRPDQFDDTTLVQFLDNLSFLDGTSLKCNLHTKIKSKMALNNSNVSNRARNQPSTTLTSFITKLQQSISDAMSTQKNVIEKKTFDKTYKNMDKVFKFFY